MEEFKQIGKLDFIAKPYDHANDCSETIKVLNIYLKELNDCFSKDQDNFAKICFYVYKVKELFSYQNSHKLYYGGLDAKQGRYTFEKIMHEFGLDETQVCRILKCYENYVLNIDNKPIIKPIFFGFNKSKLFTLLSVDVKQLEIDIENKVVRVDMSVKQLRDYVKNYKTQIKVKNKLSEEQENPVKEERLEEEIPEAFDPKKHYEFSYFENKNKAQLLNIIWEKQKEYEKLQEKYNNLKRSK